MSHRAIVTTAADVPVHLKTWTTLDLDDRDVIIVIGTESSPHEEINNFLKKLVNPWSAPILYFEPEEQTRWAVSDLIQHGDITQRVNIGLLEALDRGAKTVTVVGEGVYPLTTDFFPRMESVLRNSAPHTLVSTDTGWWNAGSLLDPPVGTRGYPISQRHNLPLMTRTTELDAPLHPAVVVHQMLGDPDVDAVEQIITNPEAKRYLADTNIVLAPGTWCPFGVRGAVTLTHEVIPLMFSWPYIGRYGDIWASLLTQRALQELDMHVVFGFPLVRRDLKKDDPMHTLADELVGMRRTDSIAETLRNLSPMGADAKSAMDVLFRIMYQCLPKNDLLAGEVAQSLVMWHSDVNRTIAK